MKYVLSLVFLCGIASASPPLKVENLQASSTITQAGNRVYSIAGTGLTSTAATVSIIPCSTNQILVWNGSAWACSASVGITGAGTTNDLVIYTNGPAGIIGNYAGTGSVADKAITAFSAAGVGTFQYFYDSPGTGLAVGATGNIVKLADTAVTPGTYALPGSLTIDQQGRVTNAVAFAGSSPSACSAGSLTSQPTLGAAGALTNNCTTLTSAANSSGGGSSTTYLNGAGGWTTPPGTGVTGTGTTNTTVKYTNGAGGVIGNAWPVDDAITWGVASRFTITEANGNFRSFGTGTIDGAATLSGTAQVGGGGGSVLGTIDMHSSGTGQTTAALTNAGSKAGLLFVGDDGTSAGAGGGVLFGNGQGHATGALGFAAIKGLLTDGGNNTAGDLAFSTRNVSTDAALTERMRIAAAGAVSIYGGTPGLNISNATQATERLRLSGQEYYQAAHTSTDGITFLLGLQRAGNRSLWIADSAQLASNATNGTFQIGVLASSGGISLDSLATDVTTALPLAINPSHGAVNVGGVLDMSSHKITSCANGTVSSDGACFGQIGTAVNAAVSGTSPYLSKFSSTNVIATSSVKDNVGAHSGTNRQDVLYGNNGAFDLSIAAAADNNANAFIFQNAYEAYNAGGDATLKWEATHGSFGSRGIAFKFTDGISFYADGAATTADTSFTPTRRMFISNAGGVTVDQTLTSTGAFTASSTAHIVGAATLDSTLTQAAGNVTLNTTSGTTAITGHGATAGNVVESDATTGLAAANYIGTSISWSGTSHEGTGAGSAPCTNGFKCVKTLSVTNTGDVVTVSEGNATSWIAIYADANNAHDSSIALYTDHGDVKLNQTSGSLLAHGAATFDNGITSTGATNTLGDLTINNTLAVTSTTTLSGATTVKNDFFVATTGGTNKLKVLAATGHVNVMGTAITTGDLSGCGTTPAVTAGSTDVSGTITEGTTATGCTLTFKNTYTNVPFCVCEGETSVPGAVNVGCHATATTLIVENASASNNKFSYVCIGATGGT